MQKVCIHYPSILTATAQSSSSIALSWTDNSANETGFKIYRGGVVITTTAANATSYTDTGLSASTSYSYYAKATNASGDSSVSNTASATTSAAAGGAVIFPTAPAEQPAEKKVEVVEKVVEKPIAQMTIAELKTEIVRITALITQLQVELAKLIGAPVLTLDVNLKYNDSGDDVKLLQTWLAKDSEVYPEGLVTGWFGPLTKKAVIRFQEKYADEVLTPWGIIEGTGFVGSTTRDKLDALYSGK